MKRFFYFLFASLFMFAVSCNTDSGASDSDGGKFASGEGGKEGGGSQKEPGVITAGEWNDLDNWSFWNDLLTKDNYKEMPAYWGFYPNNRISVEVLSSTSLPVVNASVVLKRNDIPVFRARTDNLGKAELWPDLFQANTNLDYSTLSIEVNDGAAILSQVKPFREGINHLVTDQQTVDDRIEISFVVDATGSMGDELEYLKTELMDVLSRVKGANKGTSLFTSSVFYRDEGDDYVTKVSGFTENTSNTIEFIRKQEAAGGGDYPEAVHSALDKAVNELQWSQQAKTKLLFLVLDAPPHYNQSVMESIKSSINKGLETGIKIIPVTASGIDEKTEALMRFFSISTNGTYVFITDDSGVGNKHLEPNVGEYQVELLNNLIVRLINKYSQ